MTDKLIGTLPEGVTIVGMVEHEGNIIIATNTGVWVLRKEGFVEIPFMSCKPIELDLGPYCTGELGKSPDHETAEFYARTK
jgi:hypothetical protein